MRTLIMPMSGAGTRFKAVHPVKALCPVGPIHEPMFVHAIKNLGFSFDRGVLICQREHRIPDHVTKYFDGGTVPIHCVEIDHLTEGPMSSVLQCRSRLELDPDQEIVIANVDQVMVWPGDWALAWFRSRGALGGIPTIERHSKRHSYARIDENRPHHILEVREKVRISNRATIGIYWFREARAMLAAADAMIAADDRAPNGEFYVGPVYNHLPGKILEFPLCEFWSLGEPENLSRYEEQFVPMGIEPSIFAPQNKEAGR
jgi:hypothetical protein